VEQNEKEKTLDRRNSFRLLSIVLGGSAVAGIVLLPGLMKKGEEPAEETPFATSESTTMEASTTTMTSDLTSGAMGTDSMSTDLMTTDGIAGVPGSDSADSVVCTPPFRSVQAMLMCASMDLKTGRLAFEPKKLMDQGREERVFVRLSREAASDISKGFREGPPMIKTLQVGSVMRAALDYSPADFEVQRIGEEKISLP
jgi:hypothetical protein